MPKASSVPDGLRPFDSHGVVFGGSSGDQVIGECPFCGKRKLYANPETTQWDCKSCGEAGNAAKFLQILHERSLKETPESAYAEWEGRGVAVATMRAWGLCRSASTGEWVLPGYGLSWTVTNVYRWAVDKKSGKGVWMSTAGVHAAVHGVPSSSQERARKRVCEGPWDGMKLWEVMRKTKRNPDRTLSPTGNPEASLLTEYDVFAVPGAGVWPESWSKRVSDADVEFLYDDDPAGLNGMRRACEVLSRDQQYVPKSVKYLDWSAAKWERSPGYDVRDHLNARDRDGLADLESILTPIPPEWTPGGGKRGHVEVRTATCESWPDLIDAWTQAMRWTPGLQGALACMLASITSVKSGGDQLWFKIISPPSGGKTRLCEAVSTARRYVYPKSDMTSFYSGYKEDKEHSRDFSLAKRLFDMTLVTKDADTLLTNPNKEQILGQARDIYDTAARKDYGHGVYLDYEGLRMTWILCGTPALREIDRSELGQRFLDWVIMDGIDEELEDDIIMRAILSQWEEGAIEANCKAESSIGKHALRAMQMTGGYIEYLRRNWIDLYAAVRASAPPTVNYRCLSYAKFVSYLRARPSNENNEDATREVGARLGRQLTKLAAFLAVVTQRQTVDESVMMLVKKVALDTARGRTMEIARVLARGPQSGESVARLTGQKWKTEEEYLQFLRAIGAVELRDTSGDGPSVRGARFRWHLTRQFARVWGPVMGRSDDGEE